MKDLMLSLLAMLVLTACSTVEFSTDGPGPFFVSAKKGSKELVALTKTKDFFFWGLSPSVAEFNLHYETDGMGLSNPSYVTVAQKYTLKDFFWSFLTLGLYCPTTYEVTLLTNRELK